jgi:hypothetical protein
MPLHLSLLAERSNLQSSENPGETGIPGSESGAGLPFKSHLYPPFSKGGMGGFEGGFVEACPIDHPVLLAKNRLKVRIRRANRFNVEILHEHIQNIRRQERGQARPQTNPLDAQVKQSQQNSHGLLLVP